MIFNSERKRDSEREPYGLCFNNDAMQEQRHKEMEGSDREEWMAGLKNKNGGLQRDKLKMGIG